MNYSPKGRRQFFTEEVANKIDGIRLEIDELKAKKIIDSLKIVGLSKIDITRCVITLSESEKKLLQIAISLLSNPNIIVFEEPFNKLDIKNQKRLIIFFQMIKEKYNKTIIFITNNIKIIAPLPGRGTVGIEIPNKTKSIVTFREVISTFPKEKQNNKF